MNNTYQYHDESYFKGRFDNIVSVQGFGWTGSTAVCDILSEFSDWKVLSSTLPSSQNKGVQYDGYEIQLFRNLKLMQLRDSCKCFDPDDLFDLRVKQTIIRYFELVLDDESKFYIGSPYYKTLAFRICLANFFIRILDLTDEDKSFILENISRVFFPICFYTSKKINQIDHQDPFSFFDYYNNSSFPKLSFIKNGYIYYKKSKKLRRQGLSEIDAALRELLYNFFEITSDNKRNVCYSQLFCGSYIDDENRPDFIPHEFKHIYVYRDPRDSYFSNVKRCINYSSVDYKIQERLSVNLWGNYYSGKNRLLMRFEKLVYDYEFQLQRLYDFLNLKKENHINKLKCFSPEKSKQSIGSYKKFHDQNVMERIRLALPQFYFDEPEDWKKSEKYQ